MNAIKGSTPDAEAVAKACGGAKRNGSGWVARCPAHDDHNPSLSLCDADGGRVLWHCLTGCSQEAVMGALKAREFIGGGSVPVRETRYEYRTAAGELRLTVVRRDGPDGKKIRREPKGVRGPYPLYNLPAILAKPGAGVLVVEGEKCADAVRAAWPAQVVTTWSGGTNAWHKADWTSLAGRRVTILADGDDPGRKCARAIADRLAADGSHVKLGLPEGDAGEDVADWFATLGPAGARAKMYGLVHPLAWHREHDPKPQEAMKFAPANGRPALVAVEGGAPAPAPDGGSGDMDAKRAALWYASQWGGAAAHSLGLGWFVRESGESIWTEDPGGVRIRCRIRDGLTGAQSPAKRGTKTRDVEVELRDELNVPADRWDGAEGVLGLPDGRVWDVARCVPREARPDEFVSKRLGAMPEPGEPAVWLQHLGEVFAAHPQAEDVIAWLRWWLRYSLGVSCEDESIVFLDGPPRSGKSTLAESWLAAAGAYGAVRGGDRLAGEGLQHKQWLAGLARARVVLVGELPKGGRWDVANINSLASGEVLEANKMRQDSMEFRSVSKLMITGNHRPSAAAGSGFWRRLRLLECRSPPVKPDRTRKAKIRGELGRILHWALTGPECPDVPSTVTSAVAAYRNESDRLAAWFEAHVEEDADAYETSRAIWESYLRFCGGVPVDPLSEAAFGRELSERFGTTVRLQIAGKQARVRLGLRLVL